MPELPEVHTTVEGLKKTVVGKTIRDVWSDFYVSTTYGGRENIKNKKYFDKFRKIVKNSKIISVERRGKNILINLSNRNTIIVHMKMTGHLMYGKYKFQNKKWAATKAGPLQDPFNKFIHLVFSLSDMHQLVLSDMRKFASVTIFPTEDLDLGLGPEPLDKKFNAEKFYTELQKRGSWPIKSVLLDQTILSGIGNIYSDEMLWEASVHPLSKTKHILKKKFGEMFKIMQKILKFSISKGGDSKSDYRNIYGEKGDFQNFHKVYGHKGKKCPKKSCQNKKGAIIERIVVKGRSSHFCPIHQHLY